MSERQKIKAALEQMTLAAITAATRASDPVIRELAGDELLWRVTQDKLIPYMAQ
jgi:hypothetical protein